jgi:hypothetical protein
MKNGIATPFGLAMTTCDVKIFSAFVLVRKFDPGGANNKT